MIIIEKLFSVFFITSETGLRNTYVFVKDERKSCMTLVIAQWSDCDIYSTLHLSLCIKHHSWITEKIQVTESSMKAQSDIYNRYETCLLKIVCSRGLRSQGCHVAPVFFEYWIIKYVTLSHTAPVRTALSITTCVLLLTNIASFHCNVIGNMEKLLRSLCL